MKSEHTIIVYYYFPYSKGPPFLHSQGSVHIRVYLPRVVYTLGFTYPG